jgi:integrase
MQHSPVVLSQLYRYFEVAALVEGSTKKRCRSALRWAIKVFRDVAAESITVPMIGQYQLAMKDGGLAVATVRGYFASMSEMYGWAVENSVLPSNPFAQARKIRPVKREVRTMTSDEVADFCQAACDKDRRDPTARLRWYLIVEIGSTSGLRAGEIQNLRWDDIDLESGVLRVQYRPDEYGQHWQWGAKGKTDREVPLSQVALDGFHRLKEIAPWRYPLLKKVTCNRLLSQVGTIPETIRKQPYTNFYRELREILALANLRRKARGAAPMKNGGIHVLRKTAVTNWVRHGVSMPNVQYAAGHASDQTTKEYYIAVLRSEAVESVRAAIS